MDGFCALPTPPTPVSTNWVWGGMIEAVANRERAREEESLALSKVHYWNKLLLGNDLFSKNAFQLYFFQKANTGI